MLKRQSPAASMGIFPLRLCQVLENEFATTHGALAEPPNWLLQPGDVAAMVLLQCLVGAPGRGAGPVATIRKKLESGGLPLPGQDASGVDADGLCRALNRLLEAAEPLYDPALLPADEEARQLAALYAGSMPRGTAGERTSQLTAAVRRPDLHVELNRMLLEAVFPPAAIARVDVTRLSSLFARIHGLRGEEGVN